MIILHAGFDGNRLALWAEASLPDKDDKPGLTRKQKKNSISLLPFGAEISVLLVALAHAKMPELADAQQQNVLVWLPTGAKGPLASSPLISPTPELTVGELLIAPWQVPSLALNWEQSAALLCNSAGRDPLAPGVLIGASLKFWFAILRFAGALVAKQQFLPGVEIAGGEYCALWNPCLFPADTAALTRLAQAMPSVCRALTPLTAKYPTEIPALAMVARFLALVTDHLVRNKPQTQEIVAKKRSPKSKLEFASLHDQWLHALTAADAVMPGDPKELQTFATQVNSWKSSLALSFNAPFRLCFRLEEPLDPDSEDSVWNVRYLLQANDDPSLLIPVESAWKPKGEQAKLLDRGGFKSRDYLLSALGSASKISFRIEESLKTAAPGGYDLSTPDAHLFLTEIAWLLEQAGFGVLLPAWWTRKGTKVRLGARGSAASPKLTSGAGLTMGTLLDFNWELALGHETISQEELERLAAQKSSLVRMRGQWVQLDADEIATAIKFWKNQKTGKVTLRDLVRLSMGAGSAPAGLEIQSVVANGWVEEFLDSLNGTKPPEQSPVSPAFKGKLRPYQERGYSWLDFLRKWGLGACLADDMGLGKTAQTLALLQRQWEEGGRQPSLIVCPTSVIGNWQREAQRFTPDLPVMVHHGTERLKEGEFQEQASKHAIALTSYGLLHRDLETLTKVHWSGIILDEAQNIKNSETRQARAARGIASEFRIALTGTPVENHVGDLWSLMEFLNPGFLGTLSDFKKKFFIPIQTGSDPEAAGRLKEMTAPFLLRRLKTDKSIITDLPEKQEMKVYCTLTPEQASLYQAIVRDLESAMEGAEGIQRSGIVLATLSKIKQICNHPAQFLGDNSSIPGRSGKLARLTEMLEEALEAGDKALIFTQFSEMGKLLRKHLESTFGKEVLFLHGGTSKKQRDHMVERFQNEDDGPKLFLLSLKAGGVGLNLTGANHVFHFDRWWNPAVENQATDRAFRIGQKKNVQVHKFLCMGTLEERIDEMIEKKQALAGSVVGTGEDWLTKLSNTELKEMLTLRPEAISG